MSNESKPDEPPASSEAPNPSAPEPTAPASSEASESSAPASSEASGTSAPEASAPAEPSAPKRKKRKRKAVEAPTEPDVFERPALDASGRQRPRFLLRFPIDPELDALIVAFEAGNYARVREDAPALADRAERPEVRRAAEELLRRIEPDPLMKFFLAIAVALLLAIVSYAYLSAS